MNRRPLRGLYWLSLSVAAILIVYKVYLNFFELDFAAEHAVQVEDIEAVLQGRDSYRFAVVGNINNSVGIFERKIIPQLNSEGFDFVVSAGNAVSSGGEDKYRAIYRTLSHLKMPYLLTFGPNERSRIGSFRFYDHFGPYHFSFAAGNSRLIFLDSTGTTDFDWQYRWLEEVLVASTEDHKLLFSAHPLYPVAQTDPLGLYDDNLFLEEVRARFTTLIERFAVDAVFSANLPSFNLQTHNDTNYVVTGGAGGLVINNEDSHYQFTVVQVQGGRVTITEQRLDIGQHPFWRTMESFWFFVHSLFYVGYLNFILLVSVFIVVALWLKRRIFTERNYYPNVDIDFETLSSTPLRVAMFTNNYLPFIGGVPVSIQRLAQGLRQLGHQVLIIAPRYPGAETDTEDVLRLPGLIPMGRRREFQLANVFSVWLYRKILRFRPDVIHVHHPFWLGRVGLLVGRCLGIPVIYTYHTRLEHYAHYVPLPGPLFQNLLAHTIVRRFANRCDGVIVPTESAEEYLRTIGVRQRILVQPTGVDIEQFRAVSDQAIDQLRARHAPNGEKLLISISRLSREKNIDFLLEAIVKLQSSCDHAFRLLLIGDGPDRHRLESRIRALDLENTVSLLGAIPPAQIATYCRAGDVFLFASRSETQGMVILEAMAAGMPVVAIRSSGIDDIVVNGVNGFKTPPDTARWNARIQQLMSDPELRRRLSSQARETANRFSSEQFCKHVQRFYTTILADRRSDKQNDSITSNATKDRGNRMGKKNQMNAKKCNTDLPIDKET